MVVPTGGDWLTAGSVEELLLVLFETWRDVIWRGDSLLLLGLASLIPCGVDSVLDMFLNFD